NARIAVRAPQPSPCVGGGGSGPAGRRGAGSGPGRADPGGGRPGAGRPGGAGPTGPAGGGGGAGGGGEAGGAGAGGGAAEAGGPGGADEWGVRSTWVPPPFKTLCFSSAGSNRSCTSPNRTMVPGPSGASPLTRSPSTNVPLVESRSTSTHTPSRRCSLAWLVETDGSGSTITM